MKLARGMGEQGRGDIGRTLKEARERRGASLRQISSATKIGVGALEALERNDFSRLPGGIFARAFVRAYAVEVGLDPEATIREFLDQQATRLPAAGYPMLAQPEDNEAIENERWMAVTFVKLAAISLPLIVAILYFGSTGRSPSSDAGAASPVEAGRGAPETVPVLKAPEIPEPEATSGPLVDRFTVVLSAVEDCWVAASVDGDRAIERLMRRGERETLDVRRELLLTAGNASALALTINGAPARRLGGSGQVVRARLDLSNFREYLVTP